MRVATARVAAPRGQMQMSSPRIGSRVCPRSRISGAHVGCRRHAIRIHIPETATRGAATLLKSNVTVYGETITLTFRSKGGKTIVKEFASPRLAAAFAVLRQLPGRRLFRYRAAAGEVRHVTAREVNLFLREVAGAHISLKDFRTLLASASVLEALARTEPAASERQRRRQVLKAVHAAADDLANTPAICRKSYVHDTVVAAFEDGVLERFADTLKALPLGHPPRPGAGADHRRGGVADPGRR